MSDKHLSSQFDADLNAVEGEEHVSRLKELCPNGIDIYFDNVGGAITDEVMRLINTRARIALCDQISQYTGEEADVGPRWFTHLVAKQAKVEGFQVQQFADRFDEALRQLSVWLREKKLKHHEDIVDGLENAPRAFIGMLNGANRGKALVKVR